MIGIGQIAKLMKGGLGSDEIGELLGSMGLGAEMTSLTPEQATLAFQKLWESAQQAGTVLMRVEVRKQDGERITGLLVLGDRSAVLDGEAQGMDEPAGARKLLPQSA